MQFAKLTKLALISTFAATMATQAFAIDASATTAVNVRAGPSTGYSVVDALYSGEVVQVAGCQNGWCSISHNGPDGWVSANYLSQINGMGQTYPRPNTNSSANDAATAAAVIGILGIGALVIGSAIANSNAQNHNPPPPHHHHRSCAPGYHWFGRHCVPN